MTVNSYGPTSVTDVKHVQFSEGLGKQTSGCIFLLCWIPFWVSFLTGVHERAVHSKSKGSCILLQVSSNSTQTIRQSKEVGPQHRSLTVLKKIS